MGVDFELAPDSVFFYKGEMPSHPSLFYSPNDDLTGQPTTVKEQHLPNSASNSGQKTPAELEFKVAPARIDTVGRTRTWALCNPRGVQLAEITTKSAALKLAGLLTHLTRYFANKER